MKKILLVEDDQRDLELSLNALEELNSTKKVRIDVVRDGEEALDYLYKRGNYIGKNNKYPEVVILDLKMPKVDGFDVLRQIKESKELNTIPVVVFTSSKIESDITTSYDLGANAYVIKPIKFENFKKAIKEIGTFWLNMNETL